MRGVGERGRGGQRRGERGHMARSLEVATWKALLWPVWPTSCTMAASTAEKRSSGEGKSATSSLHSLRGSALEL